MQTGIELTKKSNRSSVKFAQLEVRLKLGTSVYLKVIVLSKMHKWKIKWIKFFIILLISFVVVA